MIQSTIITIMFAFYSLVVFFNLVFPYLLMLLDNKLQKNGSSFQDEHDWAFLKLSDTHKDFCKISDIAKGLTIGTDSRILSEIIWVTFTFLGMYCMTVVKLIWYICPCRMIIFLAPYIISEVL